MGTVVDVNLRSTRVRTFQGQIAIIPNSNVFQNPVENYSTGQRRVDISCGVAYGDDLVQARVLALGAVQGLGFVDPNRPVDLYFNEFGDSSINFSLRFWVDFAKQTDFLGAQSEAIIAIKKAFDDGGITIPFPIRTLDFGVVGGERLDEILPRRFYEGDGGNGRRRRRGSVNGTSPKASAPAINAGWSIAMGGTTGYGDGCMQSRYGASACLLYLARSPRSLFCRCLRCHPNGLADYFATRVRYATTAGLRRACALSLVSLEPDGYYQSWNGTAHTSLAGSTSEVAVASAFGHRTRRPRYRYAAGRSSTLAFEIRVDRGQDRYRWSY